MQNTNYVIVANIKVPLTFAEAPWAALSPPVLQCQQKGALINQPLKKFKTIRIIKRLFEINTIRVTLRII